MPWYELQRRRQSGNLFLLECGEVNWELTPKCAELRSHQDYSTLARRYPA